MWVQEQEQHTMGSGRTDGQVGLREENKELEKVYEDQEPTITMEG